LTYLVFKIVLFPAAVNKQQMLEETLP